MRARRPVRQPAAVRVDERRASPRRRPRRSSPPPAAPSPRRRPPTGGSAVSTATSRVSARMRLPCHPAEAPSQWTRDRCHTAAVARTPTGESVARPRRADAGRLHRRRAGAHRRRRSPGAAACTWPRRPGWSPSWSATACSSGAPDRQVRVGMRLWELGARASPTVSLRDAAMPFLEDVHAVVGHHAQLGVLDGEDVLFLERLTARDAVVNSPGSPAGCRCPPRRPGWCCSPTPPPTSRSGCWPGRCGRSPRPASDRRPSCGPALAEVRGQACACSPGPAPGRDRRRGPVRDGRARWWRRCR